MKTVLVTVDAVRADHLGQFGYERDTMPVLDDLSANGTTFSATFSNGTNTGVSLPSILSSRYHGDELAERGPNVATALRGAGVTTAGFHSNALFANKIGSVAGFDTYTDFDVAATEEAENASGLVQRVYDGLVGTLRPITERLGVREYAEVVQEAIFPAEMIHKASVYVDASTLTDEVTAWLDDHADEEFFLWVHYMDPHRPYGIDLQEPAFLDSVPPEPEIRRLASKAGIHPDEVTTEEHQLLVDLYDSDLRYTSDHLQRLFDHLRTLGIWEETRTFLTADHGEEFRDHGYYYHRNRPYDELLRVPLFVNLETDRSDRVVVDEQRELLDVASTICTGHAVTPPDTFLGTPLFEGKPRKVVATGSFSDGGPVVAGRWDGWKYVSGDDGEELYDLDRDPGEGTNVADERPDILQTFRTTIPDRLFEGEAANVPEVEGGAAQRRLRDLGYLE